MAKHRLSIHPADPSEISTRHGAPSIGRRAFLARLGAAAAALGIAPSSIAVRAADQDDVYQRIWDVDQSANGIPAIAVDQPGDPARGFVRVDERAGRDPEHRLFAEVHIPAHKQRTYDLCKALFDNYRLDQSRPEDNRPEEAREILTLLDAITNSAPMAAAREHVEAQNGERYARDAWQELIFDVWFRQFDDGRNLDLSGFEHVAVGEQKGGKVNGHHFWYKYYLDDWAAFSGEDDIDYDGVRYDGPRGHDGPLTAPGRKLSEVVTLAYSWDAYDFETGQRRRCTTRSAASGSAAASRACWRWARSASSSAGTSRPRSTARVTGSSCTAA